jgi:Fe-S cluster assembly protein SufD
MNIDEFIEQYTNVALPNNEHVKALRTAALAHVEELQLPAVKNEHWKYTRAKEFIKTDYQPSTEANNIAASIITKHKLTEGELIVFVDGHYSELLSNNNTLKPFSKNIDAAVVNTHLNTIAKINASGFSALNAAFMQDGVVLHATESVSQPIQILHINSHKKVMLHQRNLIVLEPNVELNIVEHYISTKTDNNYLNNIVTEICLMANARLTLTKIQQESRGAQHLSYTHVKQHRDSCFIHHNFDFGGQNVRNWLQSDLTEHNSYAEFNGLYKIDTDQHIDNHTRVEHLAAHTNSKEFYKGVLLNKCRGVFNGQVYIAQDAQKVNAEQQNNNLLLHDSAEIDTKPQLEIYADDVKCAHGATVGQLDNNAIFYLQSRGIDYRTARKMLIHGFAQEIIDILPKSMLTTYLTNAAQVY